MKRNLTFSVVICMLVLMCYACKSKNRFDVDLSQNRIDVKIHRFDKDLIQLDTTKKTGIAKLYANYHDFLPIYTSEIINTPAKDTSRVRRLFGQFLRDSVFSEVNKKTMETFGNVSDIELEVSDAFTYIHHYFPEIKLPEVYFFVSGFNRSVMMSDKFIGIGTDFYLGTNYKHYKDFTYEYLKYNMRRECVSVDLVSATLFRMFPKTDGGERLLDNLLFRGKVIYLLSVFMPNKTPAEIMGYSKEKMTWCQTNEKAVWSTIVDQKDLFSTDMLLIRKYLNDAPFTAPISQKSPGRLGTWIGWQIVESYMKKNEKVGLRELMTETNYQRLLEKSGYRP